MLLPDFANPQIINSRLSNRSEIRQASRLRPIEAPVKIFSDTTNLTYIPPGQNCHYFADDIYKYTFLDENFVFWFQLYLSLSLGLDCWPSSLTYICGTRPRARWVDTLLHGWPSTQPNQIAHNRAAHHRAAHNPVARWCVGSVCAICLDSNVGWPNVGPTSGYYRPDVGPTLAIWLVRLWRWLPMRVMYTTDQHTTEPLGCVQLGGVLLGCV